MADIAYYSSQIYLGFEAMRAITRLDMFSALKLFALFYAVIGLYAASKGVISGADSIQLPFGFAFPLCTLYIYITVHLPQPGFALTFGLILIAVVFYAITGLISGTAIVLVYNWLAPRVPLLLGRVQQEKPTAPAITSAGFASDSSLPKPHPASEPPTPML